MTPNHATCAECDRPVPRHCVMCPECEAVLNEDAWGSQCETGDMHSEVVAELARNRGINPLKDLLK